VDTEKEAIMEKKSDSEIIAYQVGDHFLCPACYEKTVKILSVHELELSAAPVKKGDIQNFTCKHCEEKKNTEKLIDEIERKKKERDAALREVIIHNIERIKETGDNLKRKLNITGEIKVMRRKAKFIKKTLQRASEGRPLTRKNLHTLLNFFGNIGEELDEIECLIVLSYFDVMEYKDMLARQTRGYFCALSQVEQKVLRMRFGIPEGYDPGQERTGERALSS
jgi:hypothetical protein